MIKKKRVVSGKRSSGDLHLGHYFGALKKWIELQKEYECFFFAADWHGLTSEYKNSQIIKPTIKSNIVDWLSCGLDPQQAVIFVQSAIKEHAELFLLLAMITPLGWLERNPTYKEQLAEMTNRELANFGFFGYPVLQAADIFIYKGELVPIGEDQLPHLEFSRELARRFSFIYKKIFPQPEAVLTSSSRVPGVDGRKMSNSYNNAIFFSDSESVVTEKFSQMLTDPARARRTDAGNPLVCPLFSYHLLFTEEGEREEMAKNCRSAQIGCVDCKKKLIAKVLNWLRPIQAKRQRYLKKPKFLAEVIEEGNKKAEKIAKITMEEVREAIQI